MLIISLDTKQKTDGGPSVFSYSPIVWQKSLVFNPAEPSIELFKCFIFWIFMVLFVD